MPFIVITLDAYTLKLLQAVKETLDAVAQRQRNIMIDLTSLSDSVAAVEKAINDGITEMKTLIGEITNAADPAALAALQGRLQTAAAGMEAAVASATAPPAPAPPAPPAP